MTRSEKSNGHKTETPDVSHIRNVEVTHEASDVSVKGVGTFVLVLTIVTTVICLGLVVLFNFFNAQETREERRPGPMALSDKERLPPEPRLQAAPGFEVTLESGQKVELKLKEPQAEYRVLKEEWDKELRGELKDQNGNTLAIPIEQAIDQIVSGQGLPTRAKTAPTKAGDYAIPMPTAWSSGRETEKKLQ
jgi:hypothetical protein